MAISTIPAPNSRPPVGGVGRGLTAAIVTLRWLLIPRGTESRTGEPLLGRERVTEPRSVVMVIRLMEGCVGCALATGVTVMVDSSVGWSKVMETHWPTE